MNLLKRSLSTLLFAFIAFHTAAQEFEADSADLEILHSFEEVEVFEVLPDSSNMQARSFNQQMLEEFKNDTDYQYDKEPPPIESSMWDKLVRWFLDLLGDVFFDKDSSGWMQALIYSLAGGGVLFAVLKLLGVDVRGVFYRSSDTHTLHSELLDEDIHIRDFDKEISLAAQEQQYREAVRLYYLQSLQKLADAGLIQWKIDKTNREYGFELQSNSLKEPFAKVTGIFENVYYGNFPVTQEVFEGASHDFNEFKKLTSQYATA